MGGKKAPPFMAKSDKDKDKDGGEYDDYDKAKMAQDVRMQKFAADTLETKKLVDKVASILKEDKGEDDVTLFRNCASSVVHLKLAGRVKPEFDNPRTLAEMAYHLYEDILGNQ